VNVIQRIIILSVALFIISVGIVYAVLREEETSEDEGSQLDLLLQQEVREELKNFRMLKRIRQHGLILKKENFTQISNYQKYVTPDNSTVQLYLVTNAINTSQQAYASAVNWIWVSDSTLHGKLEHWLLPAEFISDTPTDPDNPVPGNMVSDCESQAYTLVSLIEALGTSKGNVRVVVGEVNFSGEIGGHAWVQLYQNGQWFELEATSGPYWDDDDLELVNNIGFSYSFFKTRPYPVVEYWAYFNDRYYYNPDTGMKSPDLPPHWLTN
jgi:hypothetical protein